MSYHFCFRCGKAHKKGTKIYKDHEEFTYLVIPGNLPPIPKWQTKARKKR